MLFKITFMNYRHTLHHWYRKGQSHIILGLCIVFLLVNLFLLYHTVVLAKSVTGPLTEASLAQTESALTKLEQEVTQKGEEYQRQRAQFEPLQEQVFPTSLASGPVIHVLDKVMLALKQDISLVQAMPLLDQIQVTREYTVFPVEVTVTLSKDKLYQLLDMLNNSGTFQESNLVQLGENENFYLPLIRLNSMEIAGDLSDQYDMYGNKMKNYVQAKLHLLFYGQGNETEVRS